MDKPNTKCRVCGKEYYCCTDSRVVGAWKSMACTPDCFKEYMSRIEESRKNKSVSEPVAETGIIKKTKKSKSTETDTNDKD